MSSSFLSSLFLSYSTCCIILLSFLAHLFLLYLHYSFYLFDPLCFSFSDNFSAVLPPPLFINA
jgi:hypothetical protein